MNAERNHERLSRLRDRSADLFASGPAAEDLTLAGETLPDLPTFAQRCERARADLQREEPEQGGLF